MPSLKNASKAEMLDGLLHRIMHIGQTLSTCCGTTAYCKADAKGMQREALAIVEQLRLPPVLEFGARIGSSDAINYWVISDPHFWHRGVLKMQATRIGDTIEEHNQHIVDCWNRAVKPDDIVFVLGDLSFGSREQTEYILEQLNGKIVWVAGNHDYKVLKSDRYAYNHYFQVVYDGTLVCMSHYPMHAWNGQGRGSVMLHGHSHGSYTIPDPVLFLDIDGVLNSAHGWKCIEDDDETDILYLKPEKYGHGSFVEKRLVSHLQQIITLSNCKVVGISSWFSSRHDIIEVSEFLGIEIIDVIDYTGGGPARGRSVLDYVRVNGIVDWAIADDSIVEHYNELHNGHVVNVSGLTGLTESNVIEALTMLGVGSNRNHVSKVGRIIDVGWDAQEGISKLSDMVELALSRPIVCVDHHGS